MMNDMQAFALLGASLGIIAGVLLYLFSKILNSPHLRRYSIMFILEAFLTVVLAFALFLLIPYWEEFAAILSQEFYASAGITLSGFDNPTEMATAFLTERLDKCYLLSYGQFSVFYGISYALVGKMHIGGMQPYGPSNHFVWSTLEFLLKVLFFIVLMVYFLVKLLLFFNAYGPLLISLGVVIRAFEPAKSMGAYLIATGLGLSLIFPLSLNIGMSVFYNPVWCAQINDIVKDPEYLSTMVSYYGTLSQEDTKGGFTGWMARLADGISNLWSTFSTLGKFLYRLLAPESAAEFLFSLIGTIFYGPLVAFVITLSFINIFTTALGGRISEIGRGFFKLV